MEIRYSFLDRSSENSPIHHIFPPTYTYCPSDTDEECEGIQCSSCNDLICLKADIEVEHRNNINYKYWVNYALKQSGLESQVRDMSKGIPLSINVRSVHLYMTLYNSSLINMQHTWEIPLIGDELIFATAVPRNGFWRILYTFVFKDNIGNTYIGSSHDSFTQSIGDIWECQQFIFPEAYIIYAGRDAPSIDIDICPSTTCTLIS